MDPEWITDQTGDRWHRVGAGGYYRNTDQDDVNLTREQIADRYGIAEEH